MQLDGKVAVVTGATRGVGRGIARALALQGARVFITGRSVLADASPAEDGTSRGESGAPRTAPDRPTLEVPARDRTPHTPAACDAAAVPAHVALDDRTTAIRCDHADDGQVVAAFGHILETCGAIDILVNNVWGGYERMIDEGAFTWPHPFWQQPLWRWDAMFAAGVRAHYHASQLAAPSMIAQGRGLIVHISSFAAAKHAGNVAYGVSKAATDKMAADMATELTPHGVTVVSLYPGLVRTEKVLAAAQWLDLSNSESPEFIGRAVAALAADPDVRRHTGQVLVAAALAQTYGFADIDGKQPRPLTPADF